MTHDVDENLRSRLLIAYVESLAPTLSLVEKTRVAGSSGGVRDAFALVSAERGEADVPHIDVTRRAGWAKRGLLVAAEAIAMLLTIP